MSKLVNGEIKLNVSERKGWKIPCIEGAEIEKFANGKNGEIKYTCVINKSILRDELEMLGLKVSKNNVTKRVIGVKFNYAYRSDELKDIEDKLIKVGTELKAIEKLDKKINRLNDEIESSKEKYDNRVELNKTLEGGKLNQSNAILKRIEKGLVNKNDKLDKLNKELSSYGDRKSLECAYKSLITIVNDNFKKKQDLRIKFYKEGFTLPTYKINKDGERVLDKNITYKFFFRNAGKAKKGEDIFLDETLLNEISKSMTMGIEVCPTKYIDLVGLETYKSLISSAIEGYITINKNEILIVKDLDCYSDTQKVIEVMRDKVTGQSIAKETNSKCKNTIWDGMGLIQGGEGFRGLRQYFFKIGAFCSDFQQYFKDYYGDDYETATIEDMFGRKVLVKDIKLITTDNAIKWLKFLPHTEESFNQWWSFVERNGCKFGVCKRDHKSKYGNLQRMSYQMINSLPLTREELTEIFKTTKEYVNNMNNDREFLLDVLDRKKSIMNINEMLVALSKHNVDFVNSYLYREYQREQIRDFKNDLRLGKLLVKGDNLTLVGNPFLLLEYVTGQLNEYIKDGVISGYIDKSLPSKNSCYTRIFEHGKKLGAFRSPHNSPNNVMVFDNDYNEEIMNKYFYNIGDNMIVVNFLYNDIQDRGNGLTY